MGNGEVEEGFRVSGPRAARRPSSKWFDVGEGALEEVVADVEETDSVDETRHNGPGHSPSNKPRSGVTSSMGVVGSKPEPTRDRRGFRSKNGPGRRVVVVSVLSVAVVVTSRTWETIDVS